MRAQISTYEQLLCPGMGVERCIAVSAFMQFEDTYTHGCGGVTFELVVSFDICNTSR